MATTSESGRTTRVYYTGDACNASGWFTTSDALRGGQPVTLTEENGPYSEGRVITVFARHIGEVYAGHCNPRFVTETAYKKYRDKCLAGLAH